MTIQDRIDEVVLAVRDALNGCQIPEKDKDRIENGVMDLGFQWQRANAFGRALCILLGLMRENYTQQLKVQFINECLDFKQFDELQKKENTGGAYALGQIQIPLFIQLVDLLAAQAIKGEAGLLPDKNGSVVGTYNGGNSKCYVETADKLPEETGTAKAPTREQAGVKTAARVAAAGKKTLAQIRKKATGAADGP